MAAAVSGAGILHVHSRHAAADPAMAALLWRWLAFSVDWRGSFPHFKENFIWLIRLDAFYYALLAFTLNFAGYEGEVMRGAFLGVPKGELEAARAFGMSPWKVLEPCMVSAGGAAGVAYARR